jgi:hypothetical protein
MSDLLVRPPEIVALERLGWFDRPSWVPWKTAVRAVLADPLTADELPETLAIFRQCAARATWPTTRAREVWFSVGRRGGKTLTMAKLVVALAAFTDAAYHVAPGEQIVVMLLAADRRQARIARGYIRGLLESDPALCRLIVGVPTQERIELTNGVVIEIHTSNIRAVRGYTLLAVIADEVAYWSREQHANPDVEVLNALRPGLATIPTSLLVVISTPRARKGAIWDAFIEHYAKDNDPVLFWKAPTQVMNPTIAEGTILAARRADPAAAKAEWDAEFRSDLESYVAVDVVAPLIEVGRRERAPVAGCPYVVNVDPAGAGTEKADSFTWSVAHAEPREDGALVSVVDLVGEARPPFSPDRVVAEIAEVCGRYGVTVVEGDRYGGNWPAERFAAHGITYVPAARTKSEIYRDLLPLLTSGRVRLLGVPRCTDQLLGLERRVGRGGRDSIDHAPGG